MTTDEAIETARIEFAEEVSAAITKLRDRLDLTDPEQVARFIEISLGILAFDVGYVDAIGCVCGTDKAMRNKLARECQKAGMIDVLSLFRSIGYDEGALKRLTDEIYPN